MIWVGDRDQIKGSLLTHFMDEIRRLREVQNLVKLTQFAWVRA